MSALDQPLSSNTALDTAGRTVPPLRVLAWEVTRSCNLSCAHCRASATEEAGEGELSTEECVSLIDDILQVGKPILILSGGEPLLRQDLFQIARYAVEKGLRVALGTNGTLITEEVAQRAREVPISRVGVSLDFPTPELQDKFRGQTGAFVAAIRGIEAARRAGIEVQINSTITRGNAPYLDALLSLALSLGAVAFHPFLLVPTGRGKGLRDYELSPEEYERVLNWICDKQVELGDRLFIKPTDAPHYFRILSQRGTGNPIGETVPVQNLGRPRSGRSLDSFTRGCLAGVSFCFVSHCGKVQGCGYLNVEAGAIRKDGFGKIWNSSPLFRQLRDLSNIKGKCGLCEYKEVCGGCRARAYEATGDWLASEPCCLYQPLALRSQAARSS
ncbi:MAG: radical SAM protein [Chloroflexi bacterium]|nr:radical SAM protein [Chloroflexota bacterium]